MARLRNYRFYSLGELNRAINKLLADLNDRPFKKLACTRREWFERLDRSVLRALPAQRYEVAQDEVTASVAVSTMLALVTMPVVILLTTRYVV